MVISVDVLEALQKDRVHFYQIKVRDDVNEWVVERRYSDFVALDNQLSINGGIERRNLPEKGLLGIRHLLNFRGFNTKRLDSLQQYLQHLLTQIKDLSQHPPLAIFLQPHGARRQECLVDTKQQMLIRAIAATDDLSDSTREMLCGVVSTSMAIPKSERHEFQSQAIAMVGRALSMFEASLHARVKTAEAHVAETSKQKPHMEKTISSAEEALHSTTAALTAKEEALANAKTARAAGKKALQEAEAARKTAAAESDKFERLKGKLVQYEIDWYAPLKQGRNRPQVQHEDYYERNPLFEDSDAWNPRRISARVADVGKEAGIDSSVVAAVQVVLNKAPSERNNFDALVLKQWETDFAGARDVVNKACADAEAKKHACTSVLEKAELACVQHETDFKVCSEACASAQAEHKTAKAEVTRLRKQLAEVEQAIANAKLVQQEHVQCVADFENETLPAFRELEGNPETQL
eukprot:TRINITY_DN5433_c0_g2_i1.p1 TRINITY_DN5433_c0_g2~~TRINITY_DN5433_c0_g2_i1.p1  ORF type:complete len:465 (+),score=94.22 TRINITY_DN5433_c0_g2_i1:61-1455(+)